MTRAQDRWFSIEAAISSALLLSWPSARPASALANECSVAKALARPAAMRRRKRSRGSPLPEAGCETPGRVCGTWSAGAQAECLGG